VTEVLFFVLSPNVSPNRCRYFKYSAKLVTLLVMPYTQRVIIMISKESSLTLKYVINVIF